MNPTRNVITDLLPLYFSGEASPDTKAMVEEYFKQDPDFERMARRMAESMSVFKTTLTDDDALEGRTLMRARSRVRQTSLGVALTAIGCFAILVLVAHAAASRGVGSFDALGVVACVAVFAMGVRVARGGSL